VILGGRHPAEDIQARIEIPANIADLRQSHPAQARSIQKAASDRFVEEFNQGRAVIGFERRDDAGVYLLGPWQYD
jgi:predicted GNAT superfamily acetyltransferase